MAPKFPEQQRRNSHNVNSGVVANGSATKKKTFRRSNFLLSVENLHLARTLNLTPSSFGSTLIGSYSPYHLPLTSKNAIGSEVGRGQEVVTNKRIVGSSRGEENGPQLDLTLRLTTPGTGGLDLNKQPIDHPQSKNKTKLASSSSSSSSARKELGFEDGNTMVVVGCRYCHLFVLVPKNDTICLNCRKNNNLVDSSGNGIPPNKTN